MNKRNWSNAVVINSLRRYLLGWSESGESVVSLFTRECFICHNFSIRLVALFVLWFAFACQATSIDGRVVGVADGDTITVLDGANRQHKIRLAGIDAPEKSQPFGHRSRESLSDLVFSKTVTVETDKVDRYGRQVGKVLVDGADANLAQVQRGLAWHYKAYEREQSSGDRKAYSDAEAQAKAARLGFSSSEEVNSVAKRCSCKIGIRYLSRQLLRDPFRLLF